MPVILSATPVMTLLATTGPGGYTLVNGTGNIFTWTAPNDGQPHRVLLSSVLVVGSTETGGAIQLTAVDPAGGSHNYGTYSAGQTGGGHLSSQMNGLPVQAGSTVTLSQSTALTLGAAVLYAELWGS